MGAAHVSSAPSGGQAACLQRAWLTSSRGNNWGFRRGGLCGQKQHACRAREVMRARVGSQDGNAPKGRNILMGGGGVRQRGGSRTAHAATPVTSKPQSKQVLGPLMRVV